MFQQVPTSLEASGPVPVGTMPKIAVDAQERKQQFKILKGKAEVVLFTHRPTWHYRQYVPKQRRYIVWSLETMDLDQAREDAIELFYALQKQLDESGAPAKSEVLIRDLLKQLGKGKRR